MRLAVHAPDQGVGKDDRQREVAELAFRLGRVALDGVVEVENLHAALPLDDDVVEGRQDAHGVGRLPVAPVQRTWSGIQQRAAGAAPSDEISPCRAHLQPRANVGAHPGIPAEEADGLLGGEAVCGQALVDDVIGVLVGAWFGGLRVSGQNPLGQLVAFLEALPLDARQLAFHEQLLQCPFGRLPVPPAFAGLAGVLEIPGEQRPLVPNPVAHPGANLLVALEVPADSAFAHRPHHRQRESVVAHGQVGSRVAPVLEGEAALHQAIRDPLVVLGNASEEGVMMRPRHHGDGVDLHVANALENLPRPGQAAAQLALAGETLMAKRQLAQPRRAWWLTGHGHAAYGRRCPGAVARAFDTPAKVPAFASAAASVHQPGGVEPAPSRNRRNPRNAPMYATVRLQMLARRLDRRRSRPAWHSRSTCLERAGKTTSRRVPDRPLRPHRFKRCTTKSSWT